MEAIQGGVSDHPVKPFTPVTQKEKHANRVIGAP